MTDYFVRSPLLHDEYVLVPGDTVPGALFTDSQAAHLVRCRSLEALAEHSAPPVEEEAEVPASGSTARRGRKAPL